MGVAVGRKSGRHLALGRRGEDAAAEFLQQQGCVVLARNWRCHDGELDIVGAEGETVVVCEVKTRSGTGFGSPAEAITRTKMARIRRLAAQWLSEYRVRWGPVRFDVIEVLIPPGGQPTLRHFRGAF